MINKTTDFCDLITSVNHGVAHQELSERLSKVVEAVEETGLAGEITVKIKIRKEGAMAIVNLEAASKVPQHKISPAMFYIGEAGSLHREDPRQLTLKALEKPPIRMVSRDNSPPVNQPKGDDWEDWDGPDDQGA